MQFNFTALVMFKFTLELSLSSIMHKKLKVSVSLAR